MYPVLPICFGTLPLCLHLYPQWWAYSFSNGSFHLGMFTTMTFVLKWTETTYHGQIANFTHYLFRPSEPPCDNVSWKKKSSVPGMDWSTCRGRFKKVSVHANMTLLIGGLMDSLWIAQNHKKIITSANGIMFQHHILTEHKQDSSINAMNFWTGTSEVFHLPDPG